MRQRRRVHRDQGLHFHVQLCRYVATHTLFSRPERSPINHLVPFVPTGIAVYVFGTCNENGGIIDLALDDGPTSSFDRWASPVEYECGVLWWGAKGLTNGSHSLLATLVNSSPENMTATPFLEVQFF